MKRASMKLGIGLLSPPTEALVHAADRWFDAARHAKIKSLAEMPKHRDPLNKVREHGLHAL